MSDKVPRVRVEAGPNPATDFKLWLDGEKCKAPVSSVDYHIEVDSEPTATVTFFDAALFGDARLRLPVEQLSALAEAEGYLLVPVGERNVFTGDFYADSQRQLAEQRRMTALLERIEQHLRRQRGGGVA